MTLLVGHVTKDGALAGPRVLEHVVDTVLSFEGDRHHSLRMLRALKHRFGSTDELGLMEMGADGLQPVADASALFLADRRAGGSGSVVAPVLEGARPLCVEVQALVVDTPAPMPRRVAQAIDGNRLAMLLAVLQRRARIPIGLSDVYASVAGGVRVVEPGADLAVLLAVASARRDKPVADDTVALGRDRPRRRDPPGSPGAAPARRSAATRLPAGDRPAVDARRARDGAGPRRRRAGRARGRPPHRRLTGRRRPGPDTPTTTGRRLGTLGCSYERRPGVRFLEERLASARSEALYGALRLIAPGTPLREGIDRILQAKMGALIVIGDGPEVLHICSGGFLFDAEFSPQRLSELAKMDGAIILAADGSRVARANVHLVPDPDIPTSETGTRHRTAERVARQISVPVITISEEMGVVSVHYRGYKKTLEPIPRVLARGDQALQILGRYKARLDGVSGALSALEVEDLVTVRDVTTVLQRAEMVRRIAMEIEGYVVELGADGRLVELQLEELTGGVRADRRLVCKDYFIESSEWVLEQVTEPPRPS